MLSGEHDPATPPQFGQAANRELPNSVQIIIPDGAHSYGSPCLQGLIAAFVEKGSATTLDSTCVKEIKRPPFVTSLADPSH